MGVVVNATPRPLYSPLYRRLSGPQDRSRRVRKISCPSVFDVRIAQPVASCYADWAIPAHLPYNLESNLILDSGT
jgi:hypothetical protein